MDFSGNIVNNINSDIMAPVVYRTPDDSDSNIKKEFIYPDFLATSNELAQKYSADFLIGDVDVYNGESNVKPLRIYHPYMHVLVDSQELNRMENEFSYTYWSPDKEEVNKVYETKNDLLLQMNKNKHPNYSATKSLFKHHTTLINSNINGKDVKMPESALNYLELINDYSKKRANEKSVMVWALLPNGVWKSLFLPTNKTSPKTGKNIIWWNENNSNFNGNKEMKEEDDCESFTPIDICDLLWYDCVNNQLNIKKSIDMEYEQGAPYLMKVNSMEDARDNKHEILAFYNFSTAPINLEASKILIHSNSCTAPNIVPRKTIDKSKIIYKVEKAMPYPTGTVIFALYSDIDGGIIDYDEKSKIKDMRSILEPRTYCKCQSCKLIKHYITKEYKDIDVPIEEISREMFRDLCVMELKSNERFMLQLQKISQCNKRPCLYHTSAYKPSAGVRSALFGSLMLLAENKILDTLYYLRNTKELTNDTTSSSLSTIDDNDVKIDTVTENIKNNKPPSKTSEPTILKTPLKEKEIVLTPNSESNKTEDSSKEIVLKNDNEVVASNDVMKEKEIVSVNSNEINIKEVDVSENILKTDKVVEDVESISLEQNSNNDIKPSEDKTVEKKTKAEKDNKKTKKKKSKKRKLEKIGKLKSDNVKKRKK